MVNIISTGYININHEIREEMVVRNWLLVGLEEEKTLHD